MRLSSSSRWSITPGNRRVVVVALFAAALASCADPRISASRGISAERVRQSASRPQDKAPAGAPRIKGGPQTPILSGPPSGALDAGFATAGIAIHHNAGGGNGNDNGEAVAIDSNGRIVVAGFSTNANGATVMALWRFTAAGLLATSFNGSGFVTHDGGGGASASDQAIASSIAFDSSGRILVGGYSIAANVWGMTIWRYNANGSIDTGFGNNGMVRFPAPQSGGVGAVLNAAGHVRAAGFTWNGADWDTAFWRYDADGQFDAGLGYIYSNHSLGGNKEDIAIDIAFDANQRIVLTGYRTNADGNQEMTVFRYDDDGIPDSAFGNNGVVSHDNAAGGGGNDVGRSIAFTSAGKIVVAGWSPRSAGDTNADMAIWRFEPNGALDLSFNGTGFVTHHGAAGGDGTDWGRGVVIDRKNRVVVAGQSATTGGDADMAVWRYKADGALDMSFGGRGWIVHAAAAGGSGVNDAARGIAIDQDQRLVVVGRSTNASGNIDLAVWRILP